MYSELKETKRNDNTVIPTKPFNFSESTKSVNNSNNAVRYTNVQSLLSVYTFIKLRFSF